MRASQPAIDRLQRQERNVADGKFVTFFTQNHSTGRSGAATGLRLLVYLCALEPVPPDPGSCWLDASPDGLLVGGGGEVEKRRSPHGAPSQPNLPVSHRRQQTVSRRSLLASQHPRGSGVAPATEVDLRSFSLDSRLPLLLLLPRTSPATSRCCNIFITTPVQPEY